MSIVSPRGGHEGGDSGIIHRGAHPTLAPAVPQQVTQYLLAHNYHLTALELLVEAQASGHGEDVRDLQAFFSDPDRFNPDELARFQPGNALELQALGRERESRLQLAEYQLRLAQEDLREMQRRLADKEAEAAAAAAAAAAARLASSGGAASAAGSAAAAGGAAAGSSRPGSTEPGEGGADEGELQAAAAAEAAVGAGLGPEWPAATAPGAMPSASDVRAMHSAVLMHLLRHGLVTTAMTLEEEYGGPLRPAGQPHANTHANTRGDRSSSSGGADGADLYHTQWALWSWYRSAAKEAAGVVEGAAAVLTGGGQEREGVAGGEEGEVDVEGMDVEVAGVEELKGGVLAARRQLAAMRAQLAALAAAAAVPSAPATPTIAAVAAAAAAAQGGGGVCGAGEGAALAAGQSVEAAAAAARHRQRASDMDLLGDLLDLSVSQNPSGTLPLSPAGPGPDPTAPPPSHTAELPPASAPDASLPTTTSTRTPTPTDATPLTTTTTTAPGKPLPPWLAIDPAHHAALETLLGRIAEALPRLIPNLTLKSRVEAIPLLLTVAKTTQDGPSRRTLLATCFNLVPGPDPQQRQAIIDACLELCRAFGPSWAASELVQMCCKQAGSPSSERRALVAEALGAAVGVVEVGTQGHVLLTQLTTLAKDRLEAVREAACLSLARLVPRLPFSRSYYSPVEALLLALATDGSETVHAAALSHLVPALLTWQPPDSDLVVTSGMARVVSEMGQLARQLGPVSGQEGGSGLARRSSDGAGVGAGGAAAGGLRHTASMNARDGLAAAQEASGFGGGGGGAAGNQQVLFPPASRAGRGYSMSGSTLLPGGLSPYAGSGLGLVGGGQGAAAAAAQGPVHLGRRRFASQVHLVLYQLLQVYTGLAPALRQAALHNRPPWAEAPRSPSPYGQHTPPPPQGPSPSPSPLPPLPALGRPHRGSSSGALLHPDHTTTAAAGGHSEGGAPAAAANGGGGATSPGHRRTSSHPLPVAVLAGGVGGGGVEGVGRSPLNKASGLQQDTSHQQLHYQEHTDSDNGTGGVGGRASPAVGVDADMLGQGAGEGSAEGEEARAGAEEQHEEAERARKEQREGEDAALAAWARHPSHAAWKTLEWLVQYVVPELLGLLPALGPHPDAFELRRTAVAAVAATCGAMGAPFTRVALVPICLAAAGVGASAAAPCPPPPPPDLDPTPPAVRDAALAARPASAEALRTARLCVLPVLLAGVLPAAGLLRHHLHGLMAAAHEPRYRWLLEGLTDYTTALTFACSARPELLTDILQLLEGLLAGAPTPPPTDPTTNGHRRARDSNGGAAAAAEGGTAGAQDPTGGTAGAAVLAGGSGLASSATGLCCAALARSLVPLVTVQVVSRRLLPALMGLMSYGDAELQRACVVVMAEIAMRFRSEGPRFSEQVLAVYDSLLEQGPHVVQLEVLYSGTALAAAAAPTAAVSAAAASQVEWMLTAAQALGTQLAAAAGGGGGGAVARATPDQQKALAAALLNALRSVAAHDLRLPRLQTTLGSAIDSLSRCKALLPDPQHQAALAALVKAPTAGQTTSGTSISSTSTPTPTPTPAPHPHLAGGVSTTAAANGAAAGGTAGVSVPPRPPLPPMAPPGGGAAGGTPAAAVHAAAAAPAASGEEASTGGQLRSRFDAFKQKLMKRKDDAHPLAAAAAPPAAAPGAAAAGPGAGGAVLGYGDAGAMGLPYRPGGQEGRTLPGAGGAGGMAGGARAKENFFSDDEEL